MNVGKSVPRVDAYDKVTGRTQYTDDICDGSALIARVLHSTVANGRVKSIDVTAAEATEGVVRVFTCFDVPKRAFPTAGHPWSVDIAHQDVADRYLLTERPLFYGDDIAAIVAENEVAAAIGLSKIVVEYEEYPFVLDVQEAMEPDAPQLHERFDKNILAHTTAACGNYAEAIKREGLLCFDDWYETPTVQHCHIENFICTARAENGRLKIVSSTQIPHIVRRVVAQALSIPWGDVRVIKPYIGGGFGNKQDVLYEPLCAFLSLKLGGRLVKMDIPREETFVSTRVRHAIRSHIISYVTPDGAFVARKLECFSNQGAYASHGHGIAAKGMSAFMQLYPCENMEADAYTVFTNRPVAGAMRGYGIPQAMFAVESNIDDIALRLGISPMELRRKNLTPVGYRDDFSKNVNYFDTFNQCLDKGAEYIDYYRKYEEYKNQTGNIRRGIGVAAFWYNTAVWPISLESSSCRMVLNQDGSLQVQLGETEIGQGADTVFAQMTADSVGIPFSSVHMVSCQDTDVAPFGSGAYASRQTYVGGFAIKKTAELLRDKILDYTQLITSLDKKGLDIRDGLIIDKKRNATVMTLAELALNALYSLTDSRHITAESTCQIKSNAYSFGCCFAEVEVDIALCQVKLIDIVNVHDCGKLINPQLAAAQVHGGMSMAIGYGLSEQLLFDPETGRTLNGNLLDYKLSTTLDHPDLNAIFVENPEPTSVFGTKALGEPPACPGAPAIRNAIKNATGVTINSIPINPHTLYSAFVAAGLIRS